MKFSYRRRREHGAGAAQPADDVRAVSSCALSAGSQVAPAADAGSGRKRHRRISLWSGSAELCGGRGPFLSATAALGAIGRSSSSSAEPGSVTGRRGGSLEEQQHRGP